MSAQGSDDAEYDDQIIPPRPMAVGESEIDGFSSRDNDKAWAIAFKVNVGIVIVSVRIHVCTPFQQGWLPPATGRSVWSSAQRSLFWRKHGVEL